MKKVILLGVFFLLTPTVLLFSLSFFSYSYHRNVSLSPFFSQTKVAYAALPNASGTLKTSVFAKDARIAAVANFFEKYKSDLFPYADEVVSAADKYGLDYRLIPAIAMQESNLCKKAPKNSYNCWGFGIYGKKVVKFDNYPDAINTITKTLAQQYKADGLKTPEEIMSRYTPSSTGSWAHGVNEFMNQLAISL